MARARGKGAIAFVLFELSLWLVLGAVVGAVVSLACYRNFLIALDLATGGSAASARLAAASRGLPMPAMPALAPMNKAPAALVWPRSVPSDWPPNPKHVSLWYGTGWRSYDARGSMPGAGSFTLLADEYGIPFRGLASWDSMAWPPDFRPERGDRCREQQSFRIQSSFVSKLFDVRWLPLTPLWPGFALNTIFYAVIAWGLWQVPLAIRRRRRRRLGRCVRCGYDRAGIAAGAVCPECGGEATR